jgi:ribokinase
MASAVCDCACYNLVPVMAKKPATLILGDINVDILCPVGDFAGLGHDYLIPALELHVGGVAANTALALAYWGAPVRLLGAVGRDILGDFILERLAGRGVDVRKVQRDRSLTGLMMTVVTRAGERTFFGSRGANCYVRPPARAGSWLRGAGALHLMGYNFLSRSTGATARKLLAEARRSRIPVSFDIGMGAARQVPRAILRVLGRADILFLSQDEARLLTGVSDPRKAFVALERRGPRVVILKLGRRGCLFRLDDKLQVAPAFAVPVADTTGCGDAFTAAFLWANRREWPVEEAVLLANAAGGVAATVVGAGELAPRPDKIINLIRRERLRPRWEPVRRNLVRRLRKELSRG